MTPLENKHRAPLAGVRVLDLTRLLPGPVCTLHLADMGADVIKIEDTGAGDYAPPALRALVQRNKRAMRLDLKHARGVAVLTELVRTADILVEGFRPGVMDKLGVGYEALRAINPKLVFCSITGYGQSGPNRDEPGHDLNYCALSGVSDQIGVQGALALSNLPVADLLGGSLTSVMGILAALFDAARSGQGRHVDISMADAALAHAVVPMVALAAHGQTRPAGGDRLTGALPCYGFYTTQDGRQLAVGALERKFWDVFCERLGRPDLQEQHLPANAEQAAATRAEVAAIIATKTQAQWRVVFDSAQCCVTPVLTLAEAVQEPQFAARDMVLPLQNQPGKVQMAFPVKMSAFEFAVRQPAPAAGQDTDTVLQEIGYSDADIASLRQDKAVM